MNWAAMLAAFWFGTAWGVLTGATWPDDEPAKYFFLAMAIGILITVGAVIEHRAKPAAKARS